MRDLTERYIVLFYAQGELYSVSLCRTRAGAERSAKTGFFIADPTRKSVIIPASELLNWNDSAVDELERMMRL